MIFVLILTCCCVCSIIAEPPKDGEKKYHLHSETLHNLLNSYDRVVKPVKEGPVNVSVSMYITHATWEAEQTTFILYLRQKWNDPRLAVWGDFAAEDVLAHIWKPDTFFPEAVYVSIMDKGFVQVINGIMIWSQRLKLKSPCNTSMPDLIANDGRVNCSILMESYGFNEHHLKYNWGGQSDGNQRVVSYDDRTPITQVTQKKETLILLSGSYSKLVVNVEMLTDYRAEVVKFLGKQLLKKQPA